MITAPAGAASAALQEPRVGPNAITQLMLVVEAAHGPAALERLLAAADLGAFRGAPPAAMVPQSQAAALHRALAHAFRSEAGLLAHAAGRNTGAYLLAHRIPTPVRLLLRLLPARAAAAALLGAIRRHAWTFAGSGAVRTRAGRRPRIEIAANPLAAGPCTWHCGVFEQLFQALVTPAAQVRETACCAAGAAACRFEITLHPKDAPP